MKFSSGTMAMCLASFAMAASTPVALETRQGATVVGSVGAAVNALVPALAAYEAAIASAITVIENTSATVSAQIIVAAEAVIVSNLDQAVIAINNTANAIAAATINAAGGIQAVVASLVQSEIDQLTTIIQTIENILAGLGVTVSGTANLEAAVTAVLNAELNALTAVVNQFIIPIIILVNAIVTAAASLQVTVYGIEGAVQGVLSIVGGLYQNIGA
ncbi:unnamed protein product [Discula destructiva]